MSGMGVESADRFVRKKRERGRTEGGGRGERRRRRRTYLAISTVAISNRLDLSGEGVEKGDDVFLHNDVEVELDVSTDRERNDQIVRRRIVPKEKGKEDKKVY
jgi:hypothetical protein